MTAWTGALYFLLKTQHNKNKNWVNDDDQNIEGGLENKFFVMFRWLTIESIRIYRNYILPFLYDLPWT